MELVEGRIFWDGNFPGVDPGDKHAYQDAMGATIAALHALDPVALGLGDYGPPERYLHRQIERWSRQYGGRHPGRALPDLDFLVEWLPAHAPDDDQAAIVHGDFVSTT